MWSNGCKIRVQREAGGLVFVIIPVKDIRCGSMSTIKSEALSAASADIG
jgi:hypothetical protein